MKSNQPVFVADSSTHQTSLLLRDRKIQLAGRGEARCASQNRNIGPSSCYALRRGSLRSPRRLNPAGWPSRSSPALRKAMPANGAPSLRHGAVPFTLASQRAKAGATGPRQICRGRPTPTRCVGAALPLGFCHRINTTKPRQGAFWVLPPFENTFLSTGVFQRIHWPAGNQLPRRVFCRCGRVAASMLFQAPREIIR